MGSRNDKRPKSPRPHIDKLANGRIVDESDIKDIPINKENVRKAAKKAPVKTTDVD